MLAPVYHDGQILSETVKVITSEEPRESEVGRPDWSSAASAFFFDVYLLFVP